MRITKLNFKNLLSFKDISIDFLEDNFNVSKYNLFIGPNNEGKSNVLKGIQFLRALIKTIKEYKGSPKNLNWKIKAFETTISSELNYLNEEQDLFFEQNNKNEMSVCVGIQLNEAELNTVFEGASQINHFKKILKACDYKIIEFSVTIEKGGNDNNYSFKFKKVHFPFYEKNRSVSLFDVDKFVIGRYAERDGYIETKKQNIEDFYSYLNNSETQKQIVNIKIFFSNLERFFTGSLKFIPSVRKIGEFSHSKEENKKEFDVIAKELSRLRDGMHEERKRFMEIKKFIQELIFPKVDLDKIEITFPWQEKDGCYMLKLNVDDSILPLSQLGSGIEQLIYMAVEILREKNETIFLIEEPETGLHPKLQRAFIRFLQKNIKDKNHQFFITSHSSVFIDPFLQNENAKLFQVSLDKNKASKISPLENLSQVADLFFELGIKGVDYLQVNGIIWVEGPSDRIYILKWLDIYSKLVKKNYIPTEGRDFSILFYGGSILSSFGIDVEESGELLEKEEDDFINLIKINPHAAVVMDRDSKKGKKWQTKKRIEKEIKEFDSGFSWITDGKEIENYLTLENITRAFVNLLEENYEINSEKSFEKFLKGGKFPVGKKEFAKKITEKMKDSDLSSNKKLLKKIEGLYQTIDKWNSI